MLRRKLISYKLRNRLERPRRDKEESKLNSKERLLKQLRRPDSSKKPRREKLKKKLPD